MIRVPIRENIFKSNSNASNTVSIYLNSLRPLSRFVLAYRTVWCTYRRLCRLPSRFRIYRIRRNALWKHDNFIIYLFERTSPAVVVFKEQTKLDIVHA